MGLRGKVCMESGVVVYVPSLSSGHCAWPVGVFLQCRHLCMCGYVWFISLVICSKHKRRVFQVHLI